VIATRSISIKKSEWNRRVKPIMVLVGGCSLFRPLDRGVAHRRLQLVDIDGEEAAHPRVVALDCRGHGCSSPSATGNDMDTMPPTWRR
jgi:hypothetical protein